MAIGEGVIFESYFVCITISGKNTLIEYGKNQGTRDAGNVYLNMIDNNRNFDVRFYAFGNKDEPVNIMDAHMVSHNRTDIQCKGDTKLKICVRRIVTEPAIPWQVGRILNSYNLHIGHLPMPCSFTCIALEQLLMLAESRFG